MIAEATMPANKLHNPLNRMQMIADTGSLLDLMVSFMASALLSHGTALANRKNATTKRGFIISPH